MRAVPAVVVNSAVWAAWGTAVGLAASRLPARMVGRDGWITRIRGWERDGRIWDRIRVRSWKDRLPEAGALFGGVSKRSLPARNRDGLGLMAAETRRAELCHWAVMAAGAAMPLWSPGWVTAVMLLYALVANAPFIVIQRYNRARIRRVTRSRPRLEATSAGRACR